MYEDITSLEDFIQPNKYQSIKQEVDDFLRKTLYEHIGKTDTIIGIDRKGIRILNDFIFDNPEFYKFNITSSNEINPKFIRNLNVLIFDNSIRTGKTVLKVINAIKKYKPKGMNIFCLMINSESATKNILEKYPQISIESCKPVFELYEEQSEEYMRWEIVFLDGLRNNDNPDYPISRLSTTYKNIDKISKSLIDIFKNMFNIEDNDFTNHSISESRKSRSFSIDLPDNFISMISPIYLPLISELDGAKIRCYIMNNGNRTDIRCLPLINPRVVTKSCTIWSESPENCLYQIWEEKRTETICKICAAVFINYYFIRDVESYLISELQKVGILINKTEIKTPELQRFYS